MKTCNTQYEALIAARLRHYLGRPPERLIPVPTYPDSIVYEAQSPRYRVIFKMHDPGGRDPDNIALEAWTCTQVRSLGVPAPDVLAVDTTRSRLPGSYFIMERAAGAPLSELELPVEHHEPLLREIGRCLRLIHSVELGGYGTLDETRFRQTGTVRGCEETWRAAVLRQVPAGLAYLAQREVIDGTTIDAVQRWIDAYGGLLDRVETGRLLHGDLDSLHVWVDAERGAITSFIDFGERLAGDPVWDMVEYDWKDIQTLLEGYEPDAEMRETFDATFILYAVLRTIPWAHKWHARGETQTADWLRLVIRKGMDRLGV